MMQYNDILTTEEITRLTDYFVSKEYSAENFKDTIHGHRLRYRNKHTDYDLENSIVLFYGFRESLHLVQC